MVSFEVASSQFCVSLEIQTEIIFLTFIILS